MIDSLITKVQVNIPYRMLKEGYLEKFLELGLNPEIGFDAETLDHISPARAEAVARQFLQKGRTITLHGPFTDLSPGSPDKAIQSISRRRFEQLAALVPIFKPKCVVCHTGYDQKRYWPMRESWLENSLQVWRPLAKTFKKDGTCLMLENVYEKDPSEILPLILGLKDHVVGFCLDIGHQAAFGEASISKWVQSMSSHIQQLHLHDNNGARDDHLALGTGNINIKGVFQELHTLDIQPAAITLEPHRAQDLMPSLKYLADIWPW